MNNNNYLSHHGIKGQKWYVRRFQNEDGSLTAAGRARYDVGAPREKGSAKVTFKSRVQSTAKAIGEQSKKFATAVGEKGKQLKEAHEIKKVERAVQAEEKKKELDEKEKQDIINSADASRILENQNKLSNQELLDALNRAQRVNTLNQMKAAEEKKAEDEKKEKFLGRINKVVDKGLKIASTIEKIQTGKKTFSKLFDNFDDLPLNTKIKMAPTMNADQLSKLATQVSQLNNINTWKNNLTDILEPNKKKVDYSDKTGDELMKMLREGGHNKEEVTEAVRVLAQLGQASDNYNKTKLSDENLRNKTKVDRERMKQRAEASAKVALLDINKRNKENEINRLKSRRADLIRQIDQAKRYGDTIAEKELNKSLSSVASRLIDANKEYKDLDKELKDNKKIIADIDIADPNKDFEV